MSIRKFTKLRQLSYSVFDAACSRKKCGLEAACFVAENGTTVCICPHDHSLPQPDGSCPRRMVVGNFDRNVAQVDHKIFKPMSVPFKSSESKVEETVFSSSMNLQDQGMTNPPSFLESFPAGSVPLFTFLLSFSLIVLVAIGGVLWLKQRKRKKQSSICTEASTTLVATRDAIIPMECFVSNPNYGLLSVTSVDDVINSSPMKILPRDRLLLLNELGEGCFGKVFKGQLINDDGSRIIVAVKFSKDQCAESTAVDDIVREAQVMATFSHKNILSLIGIVDQGQCRPPWMVFEFMAHGDLTKLLRGDTKDMSPPTDLTKDELYRISEQIALGMNYLTSRRFVHRDLACRNCLVGENLTVKIADFGMSRDVYACDYYKVGGCRLLPVRWMSPEAIVYGRFTLESDVWSYGVVLWEIYSYGKQPFYGNTNQEAVKTILQGIPLTPPTDCPPFITNIMEGCWRRDADKRLNFEQILEKLKKQENGYENMSVENKRFSIDFEDYLIPKKRESGYFEPLDDDDPIMTDFYAVFEDLKKVIEDKSSKV